MNFNRFSKFLVIAAALPVSSFSDTHVRVFKFASIATRKKSRFVDLEADVQIYYLL